MPGGSCFSSKTFLKCPAFMSLCSAFLFAWLLSLDGLVEVYHCIPLFTFVSILLFQMGTGSLKTRGRGEEIIPTTPQIGPVFSAWLESSFVNRKIHELRLFSLLSPSFLWKRYFILVSFSLISAHRIDIVSAENLFSFSAQILSL